jgi:hypothetical protein
MALSALHWEIVMALGGWKSDRMMRRFAAVTDQTLRAAAEAVSGHESVPNRKHAGNRHVQPPHWFAARLRQICDDPLPNDVAPDDHHDGKGWRRLPGCLRRGRRRYWIKQLALGMADGEVFESLAIGLQEGRRACTKQLLRPRRFEQS